MCVAAGFPSGCVGILGGEVCVGVSAPFLPGRPWWGLSLLGLRALPLEIRSPPLVSVASIVLFIGSLGTDPGFFSFPLLGLRLLVSSISSRAKWAALARGALIFEVCNGWRLVV